MDEIRNVLARTRDRTLGSLKVHFDASRMAGERTSPVLVLEGVWVENTSDQNHFVSDLIVELDLPAENRSESTNWRKSGLPINIAPGGNVAAFSRTDGNWDVLFSLAEALPTATGEFHGFVAAKGREGFRQMKTEFSGTYKVSER